MDGTTIIVTILEPALTHRQEIAADEVWRLLGQPDRTKAVRAWLREAMKRLGWEYVPWSPRFGYKVRPEGHAYGQAGYRKAGAR